MPVGENPLNTATSDLERSTDGSSYSAFANDEVIDVQPSARVRKVIERMLLNATTIKKWTGRINNGTIKLILEYSSALYSTINTLFEANTLWYLRLTADDTGGTNGSRHVFQGYISELSPPGAPGDDDTQKFELTLAVDTYTFTAAA